MLVNKTRNVEAVNFKMVEAEVVNFKMMEAGAEAAVFLPLPPLWIVDGSLLRMRSEKIQKFPPYFPIRFPFVRHVLLFESRVVDDHGQKRRRPRYRRLNSKVEIKVTSLDARA